MLYLRRFQDEDYQWRLNKILSDMYFLHGTLGSVFPPSGDNLLGAVCFKHRYGNLYRLVNRFYWNDIVDPDGRMHTNLKYFYYCQQVELHDISAPRKASLYLLLQLASSDA